jgi:hypothetical protein
MFCLFKSISKGRSKLYKELNTRILREKSLRKLEDGYNLSTVTKIINFK